MVDLQVVHLITVILIGALYIAASLPLRRRAPFSTISGRSRHYAPRAFTDSGISQGQQRINYIRYIDRPLFRTSDPFTGRPARVLRNYPAARIPDGFGADTPRHHRRLRGERRLWQNRRHLEPAGFDRTGNFIRPELSYNEPGYGLPSSETSETGYIRRSRINRYDLERPHMGRRHQRTNQNFFPYNDNVQRSTGSRIAYTDPDLFNHDLNSAVDRNTFDYADYADRNTVTEGSNLPTFDRGTEVRLRNLANTLGAESISVRRITPRRQPKVNVHSTALSNDALIDYLTEVRPERQKHGLENTRIDNPNIQIVRKGLWNDSTTDPSREVSRFSLGLMDPRQEKQIMKVQTQSTKSQAKNVWNITTPMKLLPKRRKPKVLPSRMLGKDKLKKVQKSASVKDKTIISVGMNTAFNDKRHIAGETFNNPIIGLKRNALSINNMVKNNKNKADMTNLVKRPGLRNQNIKIIEAMQMQSFKQNTPVTIEQHNENRKTNIAPEMESLKRNMVHKAGSARRKGKRRENINLRHNTRQGGKTIKDFKSRSGLKNKEAALPEQNIKVEPYLNPERTSKIPLLKTDSHLIEAISKNTKVSAYLQESNVANTEKRYSGKTSSPPIESTILTKQEPKPVMQLSSYVENADFKTGGNIDISKPIKVNFINAATAPQNDKAAFISDMSLLNNEPSVNSQQAGNRYISVLSETQNHNNEVPVPSSLKMSGSQTVLGNIKINNLLENSQRIITNEQAIMQSYAKKLNKNKSEKAILSQAAADSTDKTAIKNIKPEKASTTFEIREKSFLTKPKHTATLRSIKSDTILKNVQPKPFNKYAASETVMTKSLRSVENKQATETKFLNHKGASLRQASFNPSVDNQAKQNFKIPTVNGKSIKGTEYVRLIGDKGENAKIHNIIQGFAGNKRLENMKISIASDKPEKPAVPGFFVASAALSPTEHMAIVSEVYPKSVNKNADTRIFKTPELKAEANKQTITNQILDVKSSNSIQAASIPGVNNMAEKNFEISSVMDTPTHYTAVKSVLEGQRKKLQLQNRIHIATDNTPSEYDKASSASGILKKTTVGAKFKDSGSLTPTSNTNFISNVFPELVDTNADTEVIGTAQLKSAENKQTTLTRLEPAYFMQTLSNPGANLKATYNLEIPMESGTSVIPTEAKFLNNKKEIKVVNDNVTRSFTSNTLLEDIKASVTNDIFFDPVYTNFNENSLSITPMRNTTIMSDVFPKQVDISSDSGIVDAETLRAIKTTQTATNENLNVKAADVKRTFSKLAVNSKAEQNFEMPAEIDRSINDTEPKSLQEKQASKSKIVKLNQPVTDSIHLGNIKSLSVSDILEKPAVKAIYENTVPLERTGQTAIMPDKYPVAVDINADIGTIGAANWKAKQNKRTTATAYSVLKTVDHIPEQSSSRVSDEANQTLETPAVTDKGSEQTKAKTLKEHYKKKGKMDKSIIGFADGKLPENIKALSQTDTLQKLTDTAFIENSTTLTSKSHTTIISDVYSKQYDMNADIESVGSTKRQTVEIKKANSTKRSSVKNSDSIQAELNSGANIIGKENLEIPKVTDKSAKPIEAKLLKEMQERNDKIHSQSEGFADKTIPENINTASASDKLKKSTVIAALIEKATILPPKSNLNLTFAENTLTEPIKTSPDLSTHSKSFVKKPDNRLDFMDITQLENVQASNISDTLTELNDKIIMSDMYPRAVDINTDTGKIWTTKLQPVESKTSLISKNSNSKGAASLPALSVSTVNIKDKHKLETVVISDNINTKHSGTKSKKKAKGWIVEKQSAIQSVVENTLPGKKQVQENAVTDHKILPNRQEKSSVSINMDLKGFKASSKVVLGTKKQLIGDKESNIKTNVNNTNNNENGKNRMAFSSTNKTPVKNIKASREQVDSLKPQSTPKTQSKHLSKFGSDNIEKHMRSVFLEIAKQASISAESKHNGNHFNSVLGENIARSTAIKSFLNQNVDKSLNQEKTIKSKKATDLIISSKDISPTGGEGVTLAPSDGFATTTATSVISSTLAHAAGVSTGSTQSAEGAGTETEAGCETPSL